MRSISCSRGLEFLQLAALVYGVVFFCGIIQCAFGLDLFSRGIDRITFCPFHLITGFFCPGCGMTRAFLALGRLDFRQALAFNPLSPFLFFGGLVYLLAPNRMKITIPDPAWVCCVVIALGFGIVRNL